MRDSIPLHWRLQKQKYVLIGSKCAGCSALFFPARRHCVECRNSKMEEHRFSGFGTIESLTTVRVAPSGFRAPYIVAVVKLEGGPNIITQLVAQEKEPSLGNRVCAVFRKLQEGAGSGVIKYGFKFEVV